MRNMTKTFANSNNMSIHDNDNGGGVSEELEESTNKKRIAQTLVDLAVIALVFIIFGLVYGFVDPKIRYLTCDDPDIVFPFLEDTIPFWAAGIFASIGPLLFILLVELLNAKLLPMQMNRDNLNFEKRKRKFLICLFHGWSLFVLGCAITLLLTEIGKKWVGRLRPHFLDVCKPDFNKITCSGSSASGQDRYLAINTGLYNGASFCTGDAKKIKEARVSFPSGHSSFSWYSMVFLIIYLEARWFLLRLRYIKPLIQMAGFIGEFKWFTLIFLFQELM